VLFELEDVFEDEESDLSEGILRLCVEPSTFFSTAILNLSSLHAEMSVAQRMEVVT
jgi:hypothetical protein